MIVNTHLYGGIKYTICMSYRIINIVYKANFFINRNRSIYHRGQYGSTHTLLQDNDLKHVKATGLTFGILQPNISGTYRSSEKKKKKIIHAIQPQNK